MYSFLRKAGIFLTATAMGILGSEAFSLVLLSLKGTPLADVPFFAIAKATWFFAVLSVAPWLLIKPREGYGSRWFYSLILGGGGAMFAGVMLAFLKNDLAHFDVFGMIWGGMGLFGAVFAATFLHTTGLFGTPQNS